MAVPVLQILFRLSFEICTHRKFTTVIIKSVNNQVELIMIDLDQIGEVAAFANCNKLRLWTAAL